jgi:hypothetical protein
MRMRRHEPVLITSAADPRHVDIRRRQGQYLFWMGFRVLCFVLAVVLFYGWLRFVAVVFALIIPWVAVVVANGGPAPTRGRPAGFRATDRPLGGGPRPLVSGEHPVVEGDVEGHAEDGFVQGGPYQRETYEPGPKPTATPDPTPAPGWAAPPPAAQTPAAQTPAGGVRQGEPPAPPPRRPAARSDVGFFGPRRPPRR